MIALAGYGLMFAGGATFRENPFASIGIFIAATALIIKGLGGI